MYAYTISKHRIFMGGDYYGKCSESVTKSDSYFAV